MDEVPQLGKITTPPKIANIKPLPIKGAASEASGGPESAIVNRVTNQVTARFAEQANQKRLNKTLSKYQGTGTVPSKPKYRISLLGGGILIAIAVIVDIVEIILGILFETVIGEIVNIVIDILFGLLLIAYCTWKRMSFATHWQRYASIGGAAIAEAIPFLNIASFWILDALYIVSSVRKEDLATHNQVVDILTRQYQQEHVEEEERIQAENYMADYPEEDLMHNNQS